MRISFSRQGVKALKAMGNNRRIAVQDALKRFMDDPFHPGLNFEKLRGYTDLYSLRASRNDRIIIRKETDDDGELYVVMDAGSHAVYRSLK